MTRIPHLKWPLEVETLPDGSRQLVEIEQDSADDLRGSGLLLCDLRRGQLPWAEDVGVTDPAATTDPVAAAALIERDLQRLEPRPTGGCQVDVAETLENGRSIRLKVTV